MKIRSAAAIVLSMFVLASCSLLGGATDAVAGDCVTVEADDAGNYGLPVPVDCAEPHHGEIYYIFDAPTDLVYDGSEYYTVIPQGCIDNWDAYMGIALEDSSYDWDAFVPLEADWNDGDREIVCVIYDPANETTTGSAVGA